MDQIITMIAEKLNMQQKDITIGISGHGGAGKTTFAKNLLIALNKNAQYINTDVYIVDREIRKNAIISYMYNGEKHQFKTTASHPSAHHIPSLERDIRMLKQKMDLLTIDSHYEQSREIKVQYPINIVEGMSVAFCKPTLFDLLIYIYCDSETETKRRMVRDVEERGVKPSYIDQTQKQRRIQYELFMHGLKENYHIVINTSEPKIVVEKFELTL